jgi:hypothetical protein
MWRRGALAHHAHDVDSPLVRKDEGKLHFCILVPCCRLCLFDQLRQLPKIRIHPCVNRELSRWGHAPVKFCHSVVATIPWEHAQ